jgi:hypothetical protein
MTTTHNITNPAGFRIGAIVFDAARPNAPQAHRTVADDPSESYDLEPGEFLILSYAGYVTIGRPTGRTRRIYNDNCPTIERYEVETYAAADGTIRGRKGDRIAGTSATRSFNYTGCPR